MQGFHYAVHAVMLRDEGNSCAVVAEAVVV